MKSIVTLGLAAVVALAAGSALADCKLPAAMEKSNGKGGSIAFFSANTNSGKGNGTETATQGTLFGHDFTLCTSGGPGDDNELQIGNAQDPLVVDVTVFGVNVLHTETASDPGNSPN